MCLRYHDDPELHRMADIISLKIHMSRLDVIIIGVNVAAFLGIAVEM